MTTPSRSPRFAPLKDLSCWFECMRGCEGRWPLPEVRYRCPNCSGLLNVHHDMERVKQHGAEQWKAIFEQRAHTTEWPYGSGVWGKRELVCPIVDDDNVLSM